MSSHRKPPHRDGARPGVATLVPVIRSAPPHLRYLTGYPPHLLQQVQHEFALRIILEGIRREFHIPEDALVEQVHDASAVDRIAGKAVWRPGDDAIRASLLDR